MPLGPFDPIPPREKIRRSHVNDLRTALTGIQDAYDVAVANGFTGTRGQWLASLVGPEGPPGEGGTQDGETTGQAVAGIALSDGAGGAVETWLGTTADGLPTTYSLAKMAEAGIIANLLPDQTGQAGMVLATDGTDIFWSPVPTSAHDPAIPDAVQEWWVSPAAIYQATPYPRTVIGGLTTDGYVIVGEFVHPTGGTRRYVLDRALGQGGLPDDHCPPSVWVDEGRRPVAVWTRHNVTSHLYVRVGSTSGDLASLASATTVSATIGANSSYTELYRIDHLSDADQDTFWVFMRRGNIAWGIQPITVSHATGTVTFGTFQVIIQNADSTGQLYAATANANTGGDQVIRLAACRHPNNGDTAAHIHYLEINCVTGAITSPYDGALAANLDGTDLPVLTGASAVMVTTNGNRRWLYAVRSGPDDRAVAYAEWAHSDADGTGAYYVAEDDGGGVALTNLGAPGPHIYNNSASHYLPGLEFESPSSDRIVYRAASDGTIDTLSRITLTTGGAYTEETLLRQPSTTGRLYRPKAPLDGGPFRVIITDLAWYDSTSYSGFIGQMKGVS